MRVWECMCEKHVRNTIFCQRNTIFCQTQDNMFCKQKRCATCYALCVSVSIARALSLPHLGRVARAFGHIISLIAHQHGPGQPVGKMCAEDHALVIVHDNCYLHVLVAPCGRCVCGGRDGCGWGRVCSAASARILARIYAREAERKERVWGGVWVGGGRAR